MRRAVVLIAAIVLVVAVAVALLRGPGETAARSLDIDFAAASQPIALPDAVAALPVGTAGDLVTTRCTACHSVEMILVQPPLTPEKWQATVTKMREVYHAPIAPGEDAGLVKALVALQGRAGVARP